MRRSPDPPLWEICLGRLKSTDRAACLFCRRSLGSRVCLRNRSRRCFENAAPSPAGCQLNVAAVIVARKNSPSFSMERWGNAYTRVQCVK